MFEDADLIASVIDGALEEASLVPLDKPVPGRYYRIQFGKGSLLKTTARTYSVPLTPNPIMLSQRINNHPYNRRFWRVPKNSWERRHYPDGIINFNPRFVHSFDQQRASPVSTPATRGRSFAVIWIPSRTALQDRSGRLGIDLPPLFLKDSLDWPALLTAMCKRKVTRPTCLGTSPPIDGIDNTIPPYRWICHLVVIKENPVTGRFEPSGMATGFFIRRNIIMSCAHAFLDFTKVMDTTTNKCLGVQILEPKYVLVVPGKKFKDEPFGSFVVDLIEAPGMLQIPRGWKNALGKTKKRFDKICRKDPKLFIEVEPRSDFALLKLTGAGRFGSANLKRGHFGQSFTTSAGMRIHTSLSEPKRGLREKDPVTIVGYPGDRKCELVRSDGPINAKGPQLFGIKASITHGNSGGPIWIEDTTTMKGVSAKVLRVIGVLTGSPGKFCARGTRLTGVRKIMNKMLENLGASDFE